MAAGRQLRLLLWKDYLIRKRNLVTLGGIVWAVCVMSSLYIIRINVNNQDVPTCQFPARALPSAGVLTFLQSFICTVENTCSPMDQFVEIPSYEKSRLSQVKNEILPLVNNDTLLDVAGMLPDGLKILATLAEVADNPTFVDLSRNGLRVDNLFRSPKRVRRYLTTEMDLNDDVVNSILGAKISLQGVIQSSLDRCNVNSISKVLKVENEEHLKIFVNKLCTLKNKLFQKVFIDLLSELDIGRYVKVLGDMYYKISGDDRITQLGDMLTAMIHMMSVNSFLPTELTTLLMGENVDFSYINFSLITKTLDHFKPLFGETETYKTIRDFADMSIMVVRYLYKIVNNNNNSTTGTATDPTWTNVNKTMDINLELDKVSNAINDAINMLDNVIEGDSSDSVFKVLTKLTNFIYNLLSARMKHRFLFFSTIAAKLIEGAEQAVNINKNIEEVAYNVTQRNPEGVKVLLELPPNIVSIGLEALADPDRIQYLTDKMDEVEKMFCKVEDIHYFFNISMEEAEKLHIHLCTDAWNNYMLDMLTSFGIFYIRDNINSIARIFVLETVGKDVTEFLYSVDKDVEIIKNFSTTLGKVERHIPPNLNWSKVLGIDENSEILKNAREKSHLGSQVLITVNGALAKEVIRQSPLLEYKLSNPMIDATTILIAVNKLLDAAPVDVVKRARDSYPLIIETILLTAFDEHKIYSALATPSEEMFCKGVQNTHSYFIFPPSVDLEEEELVSTLCDVTTTINTGLTRDSLLGKAIAEVKNTTHGPFDDIDWPVLITALKQLYVKLDTEYPYVFQYKSYGMDDGTKQHMEELFVKAQEFWFSKKSLQRSIHVSIKLVFRMLDVVDSSAFNLTSDKWLRLKDAFSSTMGPLAAAGDFLELIGAIARKDNTTSEGSQVPATTATALRQVLPNLPHLIVDSVDIIVKGNTEVEPIIAMMNSNPPWPCSRNLSQELRFSERSQEALGGLESMLCMDRQFQTEWADYIEEKNLTMFESQNWNKTVFPPHMFLTFSEVFTSSVENLDALKDLMQSLFDSSDGISFVSSIEYAIDAFKTDEKREVLREFFANVDKVLNSVNTTSVDEMVPLNTLWRNYFRCSSGPYVEDYCQRMGRSVWKRTLMLLSVTLENIAEDLLTYFMEANDRNTNLLKVLGFTRKTGLYTLYDQFPELAAVLLNSYWDLGFMNQVRRATITEFWDCEAVVAALLPPPGSSIDQDTIARIKPYICPSLLYWISLPRGDNTLLDVVSKPQYFFFTMQVDNLTSNYENAFVKTNELNDYMTRLSKRPVTIDPKDEEDSEPTREGGNKIDKIKYNLECTVDEVLSYKLTDNPWYRSFFYVIKNQITSSIYLTRIAAIVNKLSNALDDLKVEELSLDEITADKINSTGTDLATLQRTFKRRPTEAIALHFDVLTDVLWVNNENYKLADALTAMCNNLNNKNTSKIILSETDKVKLQICSTKFNSFYKPVQNVIDDDMAIARVSLLNLVDWFDNDNTNDIFKFFNDRPEIVSSLKTSITYAYELGIPVYVQYLHSNVRHYDVIASFIAGDDWWQALREVYSGPRVTKFIDIVERSFDIAEDILTNLDKIHLVRLIRDLNIKSPEAFCRNNVTLRDYVPDQTELLSSLRDQACSSNTELIREIPPMLFAYQGYMSDLKLSDDVDYDLLNSDIAKVEPKLPGKTSALKDVMRPGWVTKEKIARLRESLLHLLSRETLVKISIGVLSNMVDAGTLFLNSSECSLCSPLTSWFKQINLQLYKKQEYDNLLCHMDQMTLEQIHLSLKNDFHWDMAISELISSRNYTKYELNKSMNDFLELVELHLLEDGAAGGSKLAQCLAGNVTHNALGNASLAAQVLARTSRLLRAELPHLQDAPGIENITYFEKLHSAVAHNLDVEGFLKNYLNKDLDLSKDMMKIVGDEGIVEDIGNAKINLRTVREIRQPINEYLSLNRFNWAEICGKYNCDDIVSALASGLNRTLVERDLPKLQNQLFWRFGYISDILEHEEQLALHSARLLGALSRVDLVAVADGQLLPTIDLGMQLLTEESLDSVLYSLRGVLQQLQPLVAGTRLEYDMNALVGGLTIIRQLKTYLLEEDPKVSVSELFPDPERLEASLTDLGFNNTNFWSVAAPRIQAGHFMLAPIFAPKHGVYHVENFVCNAEDMSKVIIPGNMDVVTLDDVYGAVTEQFCGLSDEQAKQILPVLVQNLNYSLILDKVKTAVITQVLSASNLSQQEGNDVLAHFADMASVLPTIQQHLGRLAGTLAEEPLLRKFRNSTSVNTFISSPSFMADAGDMVCGQAFDMNINRYYKVISDVHDQSGDPDEEQLKVLPTEFCRSLYKKIIRMNGGKIVWSFAKPLILGKILYTPDTPIVQKIIQKASTTFTPAVKVANLVHSFADAFSSIDKLTEHRDGITVLTQLLSSPDYEELRTNLFGDVEIGNIDVDQIMDGLGDIQGYESMLSKASDLLRCINLDRFKPVKDEEELKLQAGRLSRVNEFAAGVVFLNAEEGTDIPDNIEYKIRMDIENAPTTIRIRNYLWIPGPESNFLEDMRYFRGFVQIQDIIDKAIIQLTAETSSRLQKRAAPEADLDWAVYTQQLPYPCFQQDFFQTSLYETQSLMVGFFFSMLFTVASAVRLVVADRESGNTMLMSIMGVKLRYHTLSWFLVSLVEVSVTVAGITGLLVLGGILPRTDPSLIFAMLLLYGFSVVCFCYMTSKMFTAASFAAVCTALGLLVTYMPFVLILSLEGLLSSPLKLFVCLSMSSAMTYGMWFVTRFEAMGIGANWGQLWETIEDSEMTMAYAMLMVLLDALLYAAVGYLIDRFFGFQARHNNINCSTTGEKAGVSIVNVTKIYNEGTRRAKLALDNVSIELEKGQITTLLGHNGAGKTTLINILTGMLKPTKGHVVVRSEQALAKLGVCPQRDVLFEYMTGREHVALYAQLKSGGSLADVKDEVESILNVLSLGAVAEEPVTRLSGGTRRRLCVALAFVAQPSLVSLDEPTSGVDPAARREIWSMIMKLRENRTILLTTHHLDEAELLSDQIVIMHKGQIHTTGSPIDIKRSLGTGYKLTVMYPDRRLHISDEALEEDLCIEEKTKQLLALTRNIIKNANLVDVNGLEVEINLPFYDSDGVSNNFLDLSKALETSAQSLGYRSFALDCSSLEQVFFQICQHADAPKGTIDYEPSCVSNLETTSKSASSSSIKTDREPLVPAGPVRGSATQQFIALLRARYLHYTRNRWLLFMLIILPSLFVAISMAFSTIRPPADTEVALKLQRDIYEPATDFIVSQPSVYSDDIDETFARRVLDTLKYEKEYRNWTSEDSPSCQCVDTVKHQCDVSNTTIDRPQMMVLPDVDTLNDWIINSHQEYIQKRYGGFSAALQHNTSRLVAWYNNKGHHALPVYVNALNAALRRVAGGRAHSDITLYTQPLKISNEQLSRSNAYQHVADAGISSMLLLGYSLVSSGGAVYLVAARRRQEKRLQLLCGVSPALYWAAALTWDMLIILINLGITMAVLGVFRFPVFVYGNNLLAICMLIVLYGYGCSCLTHVLEKLFSEPSMANMILFCGNVFVGVSGITLVLILEIISQSEATDYARWVLNKVMLASPQYALGDGLLQIATNTIQAMVLKQFGMDTYQDPVTSPLVRYHYVALLAVGTVLLLLNLAIEYDCFEVVLVRFRKQPPALLWEIDEQEEAEVRRERSRVRSALDHASQPLRLRTIGNINAGFVETEVESKTKTAKRSLCRDVAACEQLGKAYPALGAPRLAVRDLTLGIPPGQCTALLGQNGAGKSTTFAMLTGEVRPTVGHIYLDDRRVDSRDLCTGLISYCPQSDAVDPLITVAETLSLYCQLRGIAAQNQVIRRTLETFELGQYACAAAGALSGGNRRKLCAAVAFMGRAPLVLLDEPTSGMDPASRACVSRGVRAACGAGRAVLLSTHALDDARRLAARVALMRSGRLCALAPLDDCLKRFGGGYVVACRVRRGGARAAWARVRARAPHAVLRVLHRAAVHFLLPAVATVDKKQVISQLSDVFSLVAELQAACEIEDYTVNQSSLDQMFLNFTERTKQDLEATELELLPETLPERRHSDDLDSVTAL